ncbi:U4/U6.U5 small nuclear ribonucleoprotein 27 kDa protein-like [Rosa chinensis]|uniref:U4/U6.U5 small nuclear ribonucleoprotein 27 kDa protein-like n=1 Tax=Rosa chinensis TaxID=74649 RepID=UPI000D08A8C9|nr:U4/U6.U5 small nuclear ribonucleoprotein 27 kDa protein-like [Rosa chinensis]
MGDRERERDSERDRDRRRERDDRDQDRSHRSPSQQWLKRVLRESTVEDEKDRQSVVSKFVEGIAKEQQRQSSGGEGGEDEDEVEMMKKSGI